VFWVAIAILFLPYTILYFVVKWAVRAGVQEANQRGESHAKTVAKIAPNQ
jgi:hypothetical protein